jgi:hypothetical protein
MITRDIEGFADLGIPPTAEVSGASILAKWVRRGEDNDALFSLSGEGLPIWTDSPHGDRTGYDDFLTSAGLANFRQLSHEIARTTHSIENFVPCEAELRSPSDKVMEVDLSPQEFLARVGAGRRDSNAETELYFLKGAPGTGKTTLLKEATRLQAELFANGESDFLLLYVSAQGRELSNLRDAFSSELDDLGGLFGKRAIYPLCRRGLLVPVVDGFDELLGTAGYGGAFTALQELFAELEGLGALVVSARSTFYELEFVGRLDSSQSQNDVAITTLDLQPWSDERLRQYLSGTANGLTADEIGAAFNEVGDTDRSLLSRPFFAHRFPAYLRQPDRARGLTLLGFLIDQYVERESGKITDSNSDPIMDVDGHYRLLEFAAEEMWESEKRKLTLSELETIAALVGEERSLSEASIEQLQAKLTSYAGFGATSSREFQFEHEVYFDHFLGSRLARYLGSGQFPEAEALMGLGLLPLDSLRTAVESSQVVELPESLISVDPSATTSNAKRNRGSIVIAFGQVHGRVEDLELRNLEFYGLSFGSAAYRGVTFTNCIFSMCDLSGTEFDGCATDGSEFHGLKIDEASRLDVRGLLGGVSVTSLVTPTAELYDPRFIQVAIEKSGGPTRSEVEAEQREKLSSHAGELVVLMDRLVVAFRRTTLLFDDHDRAKHHQRRLVESSNWPELRNLLEQTGCISVDKKFAMKGPRCDVVRLNVPADQLIQGRSDRAAQGSVAAFWRLVRQLD